MDLEFGGKGRGRSRSRHESPDRGDDLRSTESRRSRRDPAVTAHLRQRRNDSRDSGRTERVSLHSVPGQRRTASRAQRAARGREASPSRDGREDEEEARDPTTESAWALGVDLDIEDEVVTAALWCLGASETLDNVGMAEIPIRYLRRHDPRLLPRGWHAGKRRGDGEVAHVVEDSGVYVCRRPPGPTSPQQNGRACGYWPHKEGQ